MHWSSILYLPSRTLLCRPPLSHHNTITHTTSYSFIYHSRSTHCLSAYLFCRYTYYFTFEHKYYMNISDLPSDIPDLLSDIPDLPSDLPTNNCHYCLHIRSIRLINQHYFELTFFLLPVIFHHHRYTVLFIFVCTRMLSHYAELSYSFCPWCYTIIGTP